MSDTQAVIDLGAVPEPALLELRRCLESATWKVVPGRAYQTWFCLQHLAYTKNLFQCWHNAFMLKLPPEGQLHPHTDSKESYSSYHIVVETNNRAFNCFEGGLTVHLEIGHLYRFDRSIRHWAVNGGTSDRVHLICEVYE